MNVFRDIVKNLHLTRRFYLAMAALIFVMGSSYFIQFMLPLAQLMGVTIGVLTITDILTLFNRKVQLSATRSAGKLLSMGDENPIKLNFENLSNVKLRLRIYDELPVQFQERDFGMSFTLKPGEDRLLTYQVRPTNRGEFWWGNINAVMRS